jgi:pentatricopeptide repeat protein
MEIGAAQETRIQGKVYGHNAATIKLFSSFQKSDKVCDQHFQPEDIELTWDHTINGVIVQMARSKPRLKRYAIPVLNFPTDATCWALSNGVQARPYIRKKPRIKNKTAEPEQPAPVPPTIEGGGAQSSDSILVEMIDYADIAEKANGEEEATTDSNADFDGLFDDIFEVVLPSTLWGFHRDPARQFIAFSEFSSKYMAVLKTVTIDVKFQYKFCLRSSTVLSGIVKSGDPEEVSRLLAEMDEYKVCAKYLEGDKKCLGLIIGATNATEHCLECVKDVS